MEILDLGAWRQVLEGSAREHLDAVAGFLPNLVGALVLLGAGWVIAKLVELGAGWLLARLGVDRAAVRLRLAAPLQRAGLARSPSAVAARLLFWVVLFLFAVSAIDTLELAVVTAAIDRIVAYLPSLIGALLILALGIALARVARGAVRSGAAAANFPDAERAGGAVHTALVIVAVVVALEQVGVATAILVTALTAVIGALGVTLGVAIALGARPIVTHILAGHFLRQSLPPHGAIEVRGRRGVVERVGPTDTLLRDGEHSWSIPNAQLLDEVVAR